MHQINAFSCLIVVFFRTFFSRCSRSISILVQLSVQMKNTIIALLIITVSIKANANIRLPAIIGSHMVLQQNSKIIIWGWSDAGEKIKLKSSWDTTTYYTRGSSSAKWSVQIQTPKAGGPYTISIVGYNSILLDDVMVGEVWACSGQSNMEMNVNWGLPNQEEVAQATNTKIRFFHIPRTTGEYPQEDVNAKWVVCNPEDMKNFSAVGYFFGKKLQESLNVPVGLINASWGGTPAETWTPKELIENDSILREASEKLIPAEGWPINAAATFNAMIYPVTKFHIAGAIWYQGEANVANASTYAHLLTTMIEGWRRSWQEEFPFYFVQIAPFAGYGDNSSSAFLREAQTKVLSLPNTGMVVTSDLVNDINDIHPKMKKEVGERLASLALAETYREQNAVYKVPMYKSMRIEKNKIRIEFTNAGNGLKSKGQVTEFYIAGEDKNFVPAEVRIEKNSVVVWNKHIAKPVAVRYLFRNAATAYLYNEEGMPVNLFRTDDWPQDIVVGKK